MPEQEPTALELACADDLIQAWLEETLSDVDVEEFLSLMTRYPSLVNRTLGQLQINQMLRDFSKDSSSGFVEPDGAVFLPEATRPRSLSLLPGAAWGVFALTLFCGVAWFLSPAEFLPLQRQKQEHSTGTSTLRSNAVAIVSKSLSAQPRNGKINLGSGSAVGPGRIVLERGLLKLDFFNGAHMVIDGPCDFEIISYDRVFCRDGKLTAIVPPQAKGFRIETPHVASIHQGAGIGMSVHPDRTEMHIFDGYVELPAFFGRKLSKGTGVLFSTDKLLEIFPADPSQFVMIEEIERLYAAAVAQKKTIWQEFRERLNHDPELLLRFDFNEIQPVPVPMLMNRARATHITSGVIVGCQPTAGRWPGQSALAFQNQSDRVRVEVPGEFQSLTISTWVCVHSLPPQSAGLMMTEGAGPNQLHWQIMGTGAIRLSMSGSDPHVPPVKIDSPQVLTPNLLGQWLLLTVVIDQETQRVTHFLNGQAISSHVLKIPSALRIGVVDLGNWTNPGGDTPIHNLCGAINEFTIHRRASFEAEIRTIYHKGTANLL